MRWNASSTLDISELICSAVRVLRSERDVRIRVGVGNDQRRAMYPSGPRYAKRPEND
jgi:hypothetical protein